LGFEQRTFGGHLHLLAHLAHRQRDVDALPSADLDFDVVDQGHREAALLGRDHVHARTDRDELVDAFGVARAGRRHTGGRVGERDVGAGHDAAARVVHRADDSRRVELRPRRGSDEQEERGQERSK
jgi:hypothetical protein